MLKTGPNPTESRGSWRERVLDLAWSLWSELGVPGWARRHQDWAIDPEPLILFTALLAESDPRLRDECMSWCARNSRYIAIARLRNLLADASPELREQWGPFAASVNAESEAGWPGATEPLPLTLSSKAGVDDFRRPALIGLRLRTTFGVSARSEILQYFVARPAARASASELAEIVHYSKRNVEKELEALRKAGQLGVELRRNRLEHFVAQPDTLLLFAAPRPSYFPRWDAIFVVLEALLDYDERVLAMDPVVATVEARRLLQRVAIAAKEANLPPPASEAAGAPLPAALLDWSSRVIDVLARADAKSLGWGAVEPIAAPSWREGRPEGVRSVVSPLLATATDLTMWADTRGAQGQIPELIRRLVLATATGLTRIDLASGEAVQHGGYDGALETTTATPFVPAGQSVWEIGVGRDVKGKADDDYDKRSANPGDVDPSVTTYVFVTPRRWASKRIWELGRRQDGPWRDVRVLDADDLEAWLGLAPTVHSWLSAILGKSWGSVQDLRSYWSDWREATDPPLSAEVVLAGRAQSAERLRKRIDEASVLVRIQGESADEAIAFIAATILGMDQADVLMARSLVINDAAGWNWALNSATPLILIPRFGDPNTVQATRNGHRVLIPVGREEGSSTDLVLPRLRHDALKSVLLTSGVAEGKADDLASRGRASLISLRRRIARDQGLERPAWAHRAEAPALLPALLAGAWDETKPGDQEVISQLAERPYPEVERSLGRWAGASDAPVRKVGKNWFVVSKEDAWNLVSSQLIPTDLARFREAVLRALGLPDPAFDLPTEKRWLANVLGQEHPLSPQLREGLVDTLAIMGARSGETTFLTGHPGQWHADSITRELLSRANADESGRLWASLSRVLPLLAEAAPEPFLDAVDIALACDPSPLLTLFPAVDPVAVIFASSPHIGLLWALENLSWSAEYVGRAARQLSILSRIDPNGKLSDPPSRSLRSIFLIWDPQTAAPLSPRLAALDNLRQKEPEIAWDLLMGILPRRHAISIRSHEPRWRDWKDSRNERVPLEEYHQAVKEVIQRLLEDVGVNASRWSSLIRGLSDLRSDEVVKALESVDPEAFSEVDRAVIWNTLRSEISNHRRFATADWALPDQIVNRLAEVYTRFEPCDRIQRVAWLFTHNPGLVEGEGTDWAGHLEAIQKAQTDAVRGLRESGGLPALLSLADAAELPRQVGHVIGQTTSSSSDDEQSVLLDLLDASDAGDRLLATGYVEMRFDVGGWQWAEPIIQGLLPGWALSRRAAFLTALPFAPTTWDWVETFGEDTERLYWLGAAGWITDPLQVERAAAHFIQFGRADKAVGILGSLRLGPAPELDTDLVVMALERFSSLTDPRQLGELTHEVALLLDYLDKSKTVEVSRLAQLEWRYMPLLEGRIRSPSVLHRELSRSPQFFIEVLSAAFRAEDEEPRQATEGEQTQAMLCYRLLDSWHLTPGCLDDGTVDEGNLNAWVDEARTLAATNKRKAIADQQIGGVLRYVPNDPDGFWPPRVVRNLVERIESRDLETGLELELQNSRDETWRGVTDGGAQERVLQVQYLDYAQQANARWPCTAAMLRRIARAYAEEARQHDQEAEITEDRLR
jgi:hypothetical protein